MSDESRLGLPDRRKNTYEALEQRLDEHIDQIGRRFERWFRRGLIAYAIIAMTSAVALAGFGYSLAHEKSKNLQLCENQNTRHDNAITGLMVGSNLDQENATTEAAKAEIRRRRDVTIDIIDSLAPKVNCENPKDLPLIEPVVTAPPKPTPTKTP